MKTSLIGGDTEHTHAKIRLYFDLLPYLDEEKNEYAARDQLLNLKGWTCHVRGL